MYEITRQNGRVIITRGGAEVFNAPETSYVIHEKNGTRSVNTVKELPDPELLLALSSAVSIK